MLKCYTFNDNASLPCCRFLLTLLAQQHNVNDEFSFSLISAVRNEVLNSLPISNFNFLKLYKTPLEACDTWFIGEGDGIEVHQTVCFVRFEVFTVVTMKNGVFWVLTRATRRNNPEDTILLQW
jgi:hypothetical protein